MSDERSVHIKHAGSPYEFDRNCCDILMLVVSVKVELRTTSLSPSRFKTDIHKSLHFCGAKSMPSSLPDIIGPLLDETAKNSFYKLQPGRVNSRVRSPHYAEPLLSYDR